MSKTALHLSWSKSFVIAILLGLLPLVSGGTLIATLTLVSHDAFAQNAKEKKAAAKKRKSYGIGTKVYDQLSKAQTVAENKQYAQAVAILDELRTGRRELNPYEKANIWNLYGYIYYSQEQFAKSIEAYRKVIAQKDNIPLQIELNATYTLAQLYFVTDNYKLAVSLLEKWLSISENPGANPYFLIAQGYYQLKDYDAALTSALRGMRVARERDLQPQENWYLLLRVLYYEKKNYPKVIETLRILVNIWPKKEYWVQLANFYAEVNKNKEQVSLMSSAHTLKMLTKENELINMASIFLNHDLPYYAARLLERGLSEKKITPSEKSMHLLATAWRVAHEPKKALVVMEQIAQKTDSSDIYHALAGLYLDTYKYSKALEATQKAFQQKNVRKETDLWMLQGIAEFNLKKFDAARKSFSQMLKAAQLQKKRRKKFTSVARNWLQYVQSEQKRHKELQNNLASLRGVNP